MYGATASADRGEGGSYQGGNSGASRQILNIIWWQSQCNGLMDCIACVRGKEEIKNGPEDVGPSQSRELPAIKMGEAADGAG